MSIPLKIALSRKSFLKCVRRGVDMYQDYVVRRQTRRDKTQTTNRQRLLPYTPGTTGKEQDEDRREKPPYHRIEDWIAKTDPSCDGSHGQSMKQPFRDKHEANTDQ